MISLLPPTVSGVTKIQDSLHWRRKPGEKGKEEKFKEKS
jgi:hypothetical protein